MSRQLQDCERMLNELRDRLGEDDPLVSQWQDELAVRDAFEFRYPSKWPRKNASSSSRSAAHVERRPWMSLFERSRHAQVAGAPQRLQALH
jgi:hypothetical protein